MSGEPLSRCKDFGVRSQFEESSPAALDDIAEFHEVIDAQRRS